MVPDHAPEAVQEVASVDDQVSMEDPLLATDAGLAANVTIGDGGADAPPAQIAGSDPAPPQAAIARARSGTSGKVSVLGELCIRGEVCIRKMVIPIPLNGTAPFGTIGIRMIHEEQKITKRQMHRFAALIRKLVEN